MNDPKHDAAWHGTEGTKPGPWTWRTWAFAIGGGLVGSAAGFGIANVILAVAR